MKLFHVIASEPHDEAYIFGSSYDDALEQYLTDRGAKDIEPQEFSIGRVMPKDLAELERSHLEIALRIGIPGIGRYDGQLGWRIMPLGSGDDAKSDLM